MKIENYSIKWVIEQFHFTSHFVSCSGKNRIKGDLKNIKEDSLNVFFRFYGEPIV